MSFKLRFKQPIPSALRSTLYTSNFRARLSHKTPRLAMLLLLLVAFCLRIFRLDGQSLRGDEAATVLYSALPISELWELSRVTDPHPPLYYLMLHPWQWLVGESPWVMRFAGVAASTLAVVVLYSLARRTLHSTAIGLLAAALLAINPLQIWLAQDIRSYPFMTLLGLLSSWALWQALHSSQKLVTRGGQAQASIQGHRPHATAKGFATGGNRLYASHLIPQGIASPRTASSSPHPSSQLSHRVLGSIPWLLYILLTLACFYIHYYTAFLIAFQGLFVLFNIHKFWGQKWPWLVSQAAIGLLMIPGLQLAYRFAGEAAGGIDTLPTLAILRLAFTALLTGFTIGDTWGVWASLLLAPIWLIGLSTLLRRNLTSGSFWALFFAVPVVGVIILSIDRPFFKERFLIQAQPAFELLLAVGFLSLWQLTTADRREHNLRWGWPTAHPTSTFETYHTPRFTFLVFRLLASLLLITLLTINLLALGNYWLDPAYAKAPPWRLYHDYVNDHARPGDVMLTNFPEAAVSYYSPNQLPFYVVPVERDRSVEFRLEQTEQIAGAYQRIWFLPLLRQGFDEQGDVLIWLDRHTDRVNQVFFPVYNLNLYLAPLTIEAILISQPATFAHGPQLRGYQILDKEGDSRLTAIPDKNQPYLLTLEPDDKFSLSLYWLSHGPTDNPYTVFVHLLAADGFNRASQDNPPVWGSYPTTLWQPNEKITDKYTLAIPAGTPPGDHRLRVGWYNSTTQERVPALDSSGQPTTDFVVLSAVIRVEQ